MSEASPKPSRSGSSRRRRRILISSIVTTFVLIFGWIGIMVGLQMLSDHEDSALRAETQKLLERIRDGRSAEIYREASPEFRERVNLDVLVDLTVDINQTLGGFREILGSSIAEKIDGPGGRTRRLVTTLAFENGKTKGGFSFHWVGKQWRLMAFGVDIPKAMAGTPSAEPRSPETAAARFQAPSEVLSLVRTILELTRDGKAGEIYDQASAPFQDSIDRETFIALLAQRERTLGRYEEILGITSSSQNRNRINSTVSAWVKFSRAETAVTMSFVKHDGTWRLAHYKVIIPQPRNLDSSG